LTESLKFAIDKLELIEAANKSQFAKAKVDFFASGNNAHDMPMSKETLEKYADTILGKPLVYVIEKGWFSKEDFGGHDPLEIPCGYIPESAKITYSEREDGRTIASVVANIWKKYSDKAIKIFARDGARKAVSVEMQIFNSQKDEEGRLEILDFAFTGCTILGDDVTPAIKDANIEIFEFSVAKKKYEEQLHKFSSIDFSIPKTIQDNIKLNLQKAKEADVNLLPTALSKANYIIKNNSISPEKVQGFVLFFQKHKDDISFSLCGGEESKNWFNSIYDKINAIEQVNFSNTEIKEEKMVDNKEEEVEKAEGEVFATDSNIEGVAALERSEEETEGDKEIVEEEKEEFAEEKETPAEEAKETPEEEKKEDAEMSCLKAEMCDLQAKFAALEKEAGELREFKASVEFAQRNSSIEFSLSEVSDVMPKEKIEEWREKAKNFSAIDVWANAVKADAFTYVKQNTKTENFQRMALPNVEKKPNVKKSIWAD